MSVVHCHARLAALGLAVLLGAPAVWPAAGAEAGTPPQTRQRMVGDAEQIRRERLRYLALAQRYCAGDVEKVLAELSTWDWRSFTDVREHMRRFRDWQRREVECAALMHTDMALREASWSVARVSHLNWARRLLHLLDGEPLDQSFRRDWYAAVAALIHGELQFVDLEEHLQDAIRAFPDDAGIHMALGLMRETQTSPRLAAVMDALPRRSERAPGRFPSTKDALRQAADHYRRVLELDATVSEARLRLGRVLGPLGQVDQAMRHLTVVRETSADPRLIYRAALFAGRLLEEQDRLPEALDAYRVAAAAYPQCQTAWFALSYAMLRTGNRDDAEQAVREALRQATGECTDPWWLYDVGLAPYADVMFERLREKVRRR